MDKFDIKYLREISKTIKPNSNKPICEYCHNGKRNELRNVYVCPVCYITVPKLT